MQIDADVFSVPPIRAKDLPQFNADAQKWDLTNFPGKHWLKAPKGWQALNQRWRSPSAVEIDALSASPAAFSLKDLAQLSNEPPYYLQRILVRDAYKQTFDAVWLAAFAGHKLKSVGQGQIITGQPGIGKTIFMWYMLIRLLERKQIVLFSLDGKTVYLFCGDYVYQASIESGLFKAELPRPKEGTSSCSRIFIWSLFEIEDEKGPVRPLIGPLCFSVQSTSPNRRRYARWQKEANPSMYYMPLWTEDELKDGVSLQPEYEDFTVALGSYLSDPPLDQVPGYPGVANALRRATSPGLGSVHGAIDFLLHQAINNYGYVARDVYLAIFAPINVQARHGEVNILDACQNLGSIAAAAILGGSSSHVHLDVSRRLFAIAADGEGDPTLEFKSLEIRRKCIKTLSEIEDHKMRSLYRSFRDIPSSAPLAGTIFEAFTHRQLCSAIGPSDAMWEQYEMHRGTSTPPKFTVNLPAPVVPTSFQRRNRSICRFDSSTLPTTFSDRLYYLPNVGKFPLLDSFAVDLVSGNLVILWLIQITVSTTHGGSGLAYPKIRELVRNLKIQLANPSRPKRKGHKSQRLTPIVHVRYLLVVPQHDGVTLEWQFPQGWDEAVTENDHRGNVYCLRIVV